MDTHLVAFSILTEASISSGMNGEGSPPFTITSRTMDDETAASEGFARIKMVSMFLLSTRLVCDTALSNSKSPELLIPLKMYCASHFSQKLTVRPV